MPIVPVPLPRQIVFAIRRNPALRHHESKCWLELVQRVPNSQATQVFTFDGGIQSGQDALEALARRAYLPDQSSFFVSWPRGVARE